MDKNDIKVWRKMIDDHEELLEITTSRHIGNKNRQLICFCDASIDACDSDISKNNIQRKNPSQPDILQIKNLTRKDHVNTTTCVFSSTDWS